MSKGENNQQKAFDKLSRLKVGALFLEMGTGKTKVALDLMKSKAHKVDYMLWICPFSLKNEFESERKKWHSDLDIDVVGCESLGSSNRIYLETLNKVQGKRSFVVVDESLKIKNIRAKRTKRILDIGQQATYKLVLNGTPLSKNVLDLWTQMEFLSPKILNMSYNEFKNTYCEYYLRGKLKGKVKSQHNIPHLIAKIEPYIFDCKLDIATKKEHHEVRYTVNSYLEYEDYKQELFYEYYNELYDDLNFNAFAIKLQKFYTLNSDRKDVINGLLDTIDDKVIIFVRFLSSIPDDAHSITGDKSSSERADIINRFKNNEFKVLYITYGCGAYGLNLQFCKNMIFAEHTWDYAQRLQAEARIYRMGQGDKVDYYDLRCAEIGLEKLIYGCLDKKTNLLNEVKKEISKKGAKEWAKSI